MSITSITGDASNTTAAQLSVADLLCRVGNGDQAAWEELVLRYRGLVIVRVRSFRLQDADAHDAVQMTWLRLAENCHRINFPEHLGGWLATTASRECLAILHAARRIRNENDTVMSNVADSSFGPEQRVIHIETLRTLRDFISELPLRQKTVLRALFTDKPYRYAELADIIGVPVSSIGPTRMRALQKLRKLFEERQLGQAV
jgi:RNA polymerase sigma factor (sigma-70 family)